MGSKRRPPRVETIRAAVKHRTVLVKRAGTLRDALRRIAEGDDHVCDCAVIAKKVLEKIHA